MMRLGNYAVKPPIYEKIIERNKCIRTNGRLEMDSCVHIELSDLVQQMPPLHTQNTNCEINKFY